MCSVLVLFLTTLPLGASTETLTTECHSHIQVNAVKGPVVMHHAFTADDFITAARKFQSNIQTAGLIQESLAEAMPQDSLIRAEVRFAPSVQQAHDDTGGDRMKPHLHNYAPTYSKYITALEPQVAAPTVVEVGILTGSGLAMWQSLFPQSHIYGFDAYTAPYEDNLPRLVALGMHADRVHVHKMDQTANNSEMLKSIFGSAVRPAIVIDDGFHSGNAGALTFLSLKPFLADRFVYFIEDIYPDHIDTMEWKVAEAAIMEECVGCHFAFECPEVFGDKSECIAVITNIQV